MSPSSAKLSIAVIPSYSPPLQILLKAGNAKCVPGILSPISFVVLSGACLTRPTGLGPISLHILSAAIYLLLATIRPKINVDITVYLA